MTLIAPLVAMSGSHHTLQPYYQDLLIDSYGNTTFAISGSSDTLTGTIFVPNARLSLSGSSGCLFNMFLEGANVKISGSSWSMTGTGPSMGYTGSQLIE